MSRFTKFAGAALAATLMATAMAPTAADARPHWRGHDSHRGWNGHHRHQPVCKIVWRHHHRVRVCR